MLGFLLLDLDRVSEGLTLAKKGLQKLPENTELSFLLGVLYEKQGDLKSAVIWMKKTLELDPQYADAYNLMGYMYAEKGIHLDEAYQAIKMALKLDPDNGAYLDSMGWVYYQKGEIEQAVDYLEKASQVLPKDPVVLEHLGDAYLKQGFSDNALEQWRKALVIVPNSEKLKEKIKITSQKEVDSQKIND